MNNIESEYKFELTNKERLVLQLIEIGAQGGERAHELTVMYDNSDQHMNKKDARLRVRTKTTGDGNSEVSISYKQPLSREGLKREIEYQTIVKSKEMLELIIDEMGYKQVSSYERYRTDYHIGSGDDLIEISIDELPFGNFVEIEGSNLEKISDLALKLGFNKDMHIENSYDGIFNTIERKAGREPSPHIKFEL